MSTSSGVQLNPTTWNALSRAQQEGYRTKLKEKVNMKLYEGIVRDRMKLVQRVRATNANSKGPMQDIIQQIYNDLMNEITIDLCVKIHKQAKTQGWQQMNQAEQRKLLAASPTSASASSSGAGGAAAAGGGASLVDVDVFGLPNVKKVPERSFKCESCGQKSSSSKYAAHLERCTGKGGRLSSRQKARGAPGSGTGSSAQAAKPSTASAQQPPWDDDDPEIMMAASNHHKRTLSSSPTNHSNNNSPYPINASNQLAYQPPLAPMPRTHSYSSQQSQQDPFTPMNDSPYSNYDPNYSQQQQWPPSDPMTGQKRRAYSEEPPLATKPQQPQQPPEKKQRRGVGHPKVDDFWIGPLPTPLPTTAADGGQPFLVPQHEAGYGTEPTQDQLTEMFTNICGVPSVTTFKMCSNKPSCALHQEEDRINIRTQVQEGQVYVRFKRVAVNPNRGKAKQLQVQAQQNAAAQPLEY